jgi:hypothetical protein
MKTQESAVNDILEIVQFLRDNAATKDDVLDVEKRLDKRIDDVERRLDTRIGDVEKRLDTRIDEVKNEMIDHVDGFVTLYQKHEAELAAVVFRQERLEEKLTKVLKHPNLKLA